MTTNEYHRVDKREVPDDLIWHTPRQHQGQAIEISFAHSNPRWKSEAGPGSRWKSEIDHSLGPTAVRYYRLFGEEH